MAQLLNGPRLLSSSSKGSARKLLIYSGSSEPRAHARKVADDASDDGNEIGQDPKQKSRRFGLCVRNVTLIKRQLIEARKPAGAAKIFHATED